MYFTDPVCEQHCQAHREDLGVKEPWAFWGLSYDDDRLLFSIRCSGKLFAHIQAELVESYYDSFIIFFTE